MADQEKPEQAAPADDAPADAPADDLRRKYLEALERKHGHDRAGSTPHGKDSGGHAHPSAAKAQRMFRRKSG